MIKFEEPEVIKLKMDNEFFKRERYEKNINYFIYFTLEWDGVYPPNLKPEEIKEIIGNIDNFLDYKIEIYTIPGFALSFNLEEISDQGFILPIMFID